ncbi:MFS transporter [Catenulispora pinisilvae]|uniref:MFS transporter n=1 Tax=Catenulispora pinisilvae TaxID=2705253 RepID=UPI0018926FE9|nr:MFS transporter [Catenulispora pinisilvae]
MAEAATLGVPADAAPKPALTRRKLAALLALAVSSGFQQGYFVPLFPIITDRYRIGVAALAWTVTAPALVAVVATPVLGVLGDRLGHARVLRATACVVAAGATLIVFAPDYPVLLCGRVLQGFLAGFLPLMFALIRARHSAEDTRRAIAHLSGALLSGVLIGNICASKLQTAALSVAAVGAVMGVVMLWRVPERGIRPRLTPEAVGVDWWGAVLLAAGLVPALLALHEGAAWGWGSLPVIGCVGAGMVSLVTWVVVERRRVAPLIDVRRLFRPRLLPVFIVGWCVHFVVLGGQISYTTYFTARGGLGLSSSAVGPILLPAFSAMALFSALTARIGKAIGYRSALILGAALLLAGSAGVLIRHGSGADFAVLLALAGAGMGLIAGAGRILVIDAVRPEEVATSEGLFELLITLGAAVGSAGYAAILSSAANSDGTGGYQAAWSVGAGMAATGLVAATALAYRRGRDGPQAA